MTKFFIETIATEKRMYIVDAESEDEAIDYYLAGTSTGILMASDSMQLGELISDVNGMCEEHYQEYLEAKNEQELEYQATLN